MATTYFIDMDDFRMNMRYMTLEDVHNQLEDWLSDHANEMSCVVVEFLRMALTKTNKNDILSLLNNAEQAQKRTAIENWADDTDDET